MKEMLYAILRVVIVLAAILFVFKVFKWDWHKRVVIETGEENMFPKYTPGRYGINTSYATARDLPVGNAVAFSPPDKPDESHVAWVVAVAGDRVEIKGNKLLVNGSESSVEVKGLRKDQPEIIVPRDCAYIMFTLRGGDSLDFGPLPMHSILGAVK